MSVIGEVRFLVKSACFFGWRSADVTARGTGTFFRWERPGKGGRNAGMRRGALAREPGLLAPCSGEDLVMWREETP
jgi:hypothetical protein